MYLASLVDELLESKKEKLIGRNTFSDIIKILNRTFCRKLPFKFSFVIEKNLKKDEYAISGLYDIDSDIKYIIFSFCGKSKYLDLRNWIDFKFTVSQVCQHESIHQCQWQRRDPDSYKRLEVDFRDLTNSLKMEQRYLSDPDEIDAYGHDLAMEIKRYYSKEPPSNVIKKINKVKKLNTYSYYKKTFSNDIAKWKKIRVKLLKKTTQWLPYVTVYNA
jgi:hypothetical protein